jgi:hypothetical protein
VRAGRLSEVPLGNPRSAAYAHLRRPVHRQQATDANGGMKWIEKGRGYNTAWLPIGSIRAAPRPTNIMLRLDVPINNLLTLGASPRHDNAWMVMQ